MLRCVLFSFFVQVSVCAMCATLTGEARMQAISWKLSRQKDQVLGILFDRRSRSAERRSRFRLDGTSDEDLNV